MDIFDLVSDMQKKNIQEEIMEKEKKRMLKGKIRAKERSKDRLQGKEVDLEMENNAEVLCSSG